MATAKSSRKVIRYFRHSDPKTLDDTHYEVGDSYSGSQVEDNQISPEGPDGQGPVLGEEIASKETAPAPATSTKENK